jgi:hypothetical protein
VHDCPTGRTTITILVADRRSVEKGRAMRFAEGTCNWLFDEHRREYGCVGTFTADPGQVFFRNFNCLNV